jgi:hypothetical protein
LISALRAKLNSSILIRSLSLYAQASKLELISSAQSLKNASEKHLELLSRNSSHSIILLEIYEHGEIPKNMSRISLRIPRILVLPS